jgi:hypothetical protein
MVSIAVTEITLRLLGLQWLHGRLLVLLGLLVGRAGRMGGLTRPTVRHAVSRSRCSTVSRAVEPGAEPPGKEEV